MVRRRLVGVDVVALVTEAAMNRGGYPNVHCWHVRWESSLRARNGFGVWELMVVVGGAPLSLDWWPAEDIVG